MDKIHIAECFGAAAAHYDEHAHVQQRILNWSFDNLSLSSAPMQSLDPNKQIGQVVDLGCGTGNALLRLSALADTVSAIDIAQPMLDYAQSRSNSVSNITYRCADFDALTAVFTPSSVDWVFSSMALQWSSSPEKVLADISTILGPNGRATLTILIAPSFANLHQAWSIIGRGHAVNSFASLTQWLEAAKCAGLSCASQSAVFTDEYPDFLSMLHSIKDVGASSAVAEPADNPSSTMLTKRQFREACAVFLDCNNGVYSLDYHVVQLHLSS